MPTINLSTGSLHYREQGRGEPLLLLHANPGDSLDYGAVMPALAQHFRVLALDWPGFGKSMMPPRPDRADCDLMFNTLVEFIHALHLEKVLLMGCSMGGNMAARYAIEYPERVEGLVLIAPAGFTPHGPMTRSFCRLQGSRLSLHPRTWANQYLKRKNEFTTAMKRRAQHQQALPQRRALARALWRDFSRPHVDLRDKAAAIKAPVLLFFGKRDPAIPAHKDGREAQRCIAHAVQQVMPCGHEAFAEMPEEFLQATLPFLRECVVQPEPA